MKLSATAYIKNKIVVTTEIKNKVEATAYIKSLSPIELPEILIDSLNAGEPIDETYLPINANGLTGISGGQP